MKERILVVEDNKGLAKLVAKKMEKEIDVEVVLAHSMAEAQAEIERNPEFFLALLDLNLPDAPDGEIVDFMLDKNILSIVLTGNMDENTKKLFMHKDIIDYLVKDNINSVNYIIYAIDRLNKNRKTKVMVVDDSTPIRNEIKRILMYQQFEVFAATNGKEALEHLVANPDIKLVLTDYNMPEMDGFELMKAIRENYDKTQIAVIVLTANLEDGIGSKFLKNGANDYIRKPFSKEELICRVNNTVEAIENIDIMSRFANTDFLTGVYNRRYFFSYMNDYYRKNAGKNETGFSVSMFDIDNFKRINDTYGHDVGDIVIQRLALTLLSEVSNQGITARFGGEEFCVVVFDTDLEGGVDKMEHIRKTIEEIEIPIKDQEAPLKFTVSIGVTCGDFNKNIETLITQADEGLYEAKNTGKNKVVPK